MHVKNAQKSGRFARLAKAVKAKAGSRRFIRYSLLAGNVAVLAVISLFVLSGSPPNHVIPKNNASSIVRDDAAPNPLDQPSSVDIAENLARMAGLPEVLSVVNQADSVDIESTLSSAGEVVVSKPQAVNTALKSKKDIRQYVVQGGDTVPSVAEKFGITSESIRWSNSLTGDNLAAGNKIWIPPVNGIVYVVKAGDTPDSLAQKYKTSKELIVAYNDAEINGLKVGEQIILPNAQQPVAISAPSYYGFSWGSSAIYGFNGYDPGFCTWHVANRRMDIGKPLPANLGNAYTWDDRARLAGLPVVYGKPIRGAAVVTETRSNPGHVAFVEEVYADGSAKISEMNKNWVRFQITTRVMSPSEAANYNYIH